MLRFRSQFEDDWSLVTFEGPEADEACSILAARLVNRGDEVELLVDGEWESVGED
jgi:hypothetical protein